MIFTCLKQKRCTALHVFYVSGHLQFDLHACKSILLSSLISIFKLS